MLNRPQYRPETVMSGRRSPFLWVLVLLSLFVAVLGVRQWLEGRRVLAIQSAPAPMVSYPAPDFRLAAAGGGEVRLSDLEGKVVLLNFWATWCPPCTAEMPALEALGREHGAAQGLVVLGVDAQESKEVVAAFGRERGVSFPLLLDSQGTVSFDLYKVHSLPTTVIVDREGNIRDMWLGQISQPAMLARLQHVW